MPENEPFLKWDGPKTKLNRLKNISETYLEFWKGIFMFEEAVKTGPARTAEMFLSFLWITYEKVNV